MKNSIFWRENSNIWKLCHFDGKNQSFKNFLIFGAKIQMFEKLCYFNFVHFNAILKSIWIFAPKICNRILKIPKFFLFTNFRLQQEYEWCPWRIQRWRQPQSLQSRRGKFLNGFKKDDCLHTSMLTSSHLDFCFSHRKSILSASRSLWTSSWKSLPQKICASISSWAL